MHVARTRIAAAIGSVVLVAAGAIAVNGASHAGATPIATAVDTSAARGQKVLVDTDFGELNDDSQALYLLTQSGADVLGVTTVSGNVWAEEATAYALRQLQQVNLPAVPVYQGAADPLDGSRQFRQDAEARTYGKLDYVGAWDHREPRSYQDLAKAPYGGYAAKARNAGNAVDFIVDQIKANPHEVTLFVLGPATNIAQAVTRHPEIVPLVKQVIYMNGAYSAPGNQGPASEFNVWFDPHASKIALNAPFPSVTIVPLDVTDTVSFGKAEYDRIVNASSTPITDEFKAILGPQFATDPTYSTYVYDSIAAAIFLDPTLVSDSRLANIQVDDTQGVDFGRTLAYPPADAPVGTAEATIVERIDVPRFFDLFVQQMTAPIPV